MNPFTLLTAVVVPMDQANIDTDAIIPKQYLTSIEKTGFGEHLFEQWRYVEKLGKRVPNPDFVLNQPIYQGAQILLSRKNFGCGSSREHAAWAIEQYGIRTIIATSFADIFFNNAINNGILPIVLPSSTIQNLFELSATQKPLTLRIDLSKKIITLPSTEVIEFKIDDLHQQKLLHGWDDIDLTFQKKHQIKAYEARQKKQTPWLFE